MEGASPEKVSNSFLFSLSSCPTIPIKVKKCLKGYMRLQEALVGICLVISAWSCCSWWLLSPAGLLPSWLDLALVPDQIPTLSSNASFLLLTSEVFVMLCIMVHFMPSVLLVECCGKYHWREGNCLPAGALWLVPSWDESFPESWVKSVCSSLELGILRKKYLARFSWKFIYFFFFFKHEVLLKVQSSSVIAIQSLVFSAW